SPQAWSLSPPSRVLSRSNIARATAAHLIRQKPPSLPVSHRLNTIDTGAGVDCSALGFCGTMLSTSFTYAFREITVIDADGFRPNVGIMVANAQGEVLWARRVGQDAWQFPQGGINPEETPEDALYRELREEIGLLPEHVEVLACTR